MKNPWTKKNPFLSMWLSGANSVAGKARSRATAEGRRQASGMMTETTKQIIDFWSAGMLSKPPAKRRKKRS
jgi:hypothetical protein